MQGKKREKKKLVNLELLDKVLLARQNCVLYHIKKKKKFYKVMTVSMNLSYLVFMVSWVPTYQAKTFFFFLSNKVMILFVLR